LNQEARNRAARKLDRSSRHWPELVSATWRRARKRWYGPVGSA